MTVIVAVTDNPEGRLALTSAATEAKGFGTDLVVVNLGLTSLDVSGVDPDVDITVVDRVGRDDRDPVDAVLDEITDRQPSRLVIGVKRRSPLGKAVLGSVSQRLLLHSPIPVLAVKLDDDEE
ncbi:universal stress protein [Tsukamurella soli]|uniref:universal stress protein n=1 Tax=Tsukamurella soli TaxID=644556 RepID=UPI00360B04B5